MIIIIALVFVITVFHSKCTHPFLKVPSDCGVGTKMTEGNRRDAVHYHNNKRFYLATGIPFENNRDIKFPTASGMNALYYDCDLENAAYEIAKGCHKSYPDFDYVGSNNATHPDFFLPFSFIEEAVNNWWNTAQKDGTLVNLTPTDENREMVPFLQMANGETNKVGCAYHVCNEEEYELSEEHGYDQKSFVLFVCAYGDPQIKVGSPIYTEGPPCDSCKDRCIFNHALCDTKIA